MSNLNEQRLQKSVFVLLHGVKAFADGEWQPILLDLVHGVGFDAESLQFDDRLALYEQMSSSVALLDVWGCRDEPRRIVFGVAVIWKDKINEAATYWLDEVALSIRSIRASQIRERITHGKGPLDILTDQETRGLQEYLQKRLNFLTEQDAFESDPKTFDAFQRLTRAKESDLEEFTEFFLQAYESLEEAVSRSKALEPIILSETGVTFVQSSPPGPHGKNLSDGMELCQGTHLHCGGRFSFYRISETYLHIVCDQCHWKKEYPVSTVQTFAHLRHFSSQSRYSKE